MKAHFPNLEISTSLPNNIEINSAKADPEVLKATAYHTACTNEEDGVAIGIETCLKEV